MTGPTGLALPLPPEWMADAVCAQIGGEAWFPEKGGSTREAKKICGGCDVKAKCLEYALTTGERFGIWGGLSERERRRLTLHAERPVEDAQPAPVRSGSGKWTDEATRARVADLTSKGWTAEDIAAELDVSARTVWRIQARQRTGQAPTVLEVAPPPPVVEPPVEVPPKRIRPWRPEELAAAVAELAGHGMNPAEIAAQLGVSVRRVRRTGRVAA